MSHVMLDLPPDLLARLGVLARQMNLTEAELANEALAGMVAQQERMRERIERGLRQAEDGDFASDDELAAFFARYTHGAARTSGWHARAVCARTAFHRGLPLA